MSLPGRRAGQVSTKAFTLRTLVASGIVGTVRPDRLLGLANALMRWGATFAAGYAAAVVRYPGEPAIVDELGTLTFRQVHERTNALAHALSDDGLREGDSVGVMVRNHRGFIETLVACSKL